MVDVHPTPPHAGKIGSFFGQSTAGLPNWAWILVIGAGIAAAIIVPKFLGKSSNSASGDTSGLDPTTGLPYATEGSGGSSTQTPPPTSQQPYWKTKDQPQSGWGSGTPNIAIRKTPGGDIVGSVPFGSRINILGSAVTGPNNFQGAPSGVGSTLWYPVENGFISAWDVIQVSASSTLWPYG